MIDNLTTALINMTNTTATNASTPSSSENMPWYVPLVCVAFCGSLYLAGRAYIALQERQHSAYRLFNTTHEKRLLTATEDDWNPAGLC